MLVLRSLTRQAYLPLAICLFCIGVVICRPILKILMPQLGTAALAFALPAILGIAPSFWLYVKGITSEYPWHFTRSTVRHFTLSALGFLIAIFTLILPSELTYGLLGNGDETVLENTTPVLRYLIYTALIITFLLVLGWAVQSAYYFYRIIYRLHDYRTHLKDLFASTETREIRWLSWLLLAVGGVWGASAVNIVWDNIFNIRLINDIAINAVTLIMIWSICIWGLRQKPGFEEIYNTADDSDKVLINNDQELKARTQSKYQRSALNQEQSNKIASDMKFAMTQNQLYLDNTLSLQKLAKHINTSPNYISQTLNETLGMNFFDYVNKHRIEDAQQRLLNTRDSVMDIAMAVGFNAKSSFYTAFKKETDKTPSQYRSQLK